jgi:hypothetical protein
MAFKFCGDLESSRANGIVVSRMRPVSFDECEHRPCGARRAAIPKPSAHGQSGTTPQRDRRTSGTAMSDGRWVVLIEEVCITRSRS